MRPANLWALLAFAASPTHAEQLLFDHRTVPEIGAVLDSGRDDMVHFDKPNPNYVFDRITIAGRSVEDWTEALEIVVRKPGKAVKTTSDWMRQIRGQTTADCAAEVTTISSDETSLTFAREAQACRGAASEASLYRVIAGRRSLYLLSARYKGTMPQARRDQWLALLASARIAD